jgi:hypothetical protein
LQMSFIANVIYRKGHLSQRSVLIESVFSFDTDYHVIPCNDIYVLHT